MGEVGRRLPAPPRPVGTAREREEEWVWAVERERERAREEKRPREVDRSAGAKRRRAGERGEVSTAAAITHAVMITLQGFRLTSVSVVRERPSPLLTPRRLYALSPRAERIPDRTHRPRQTPSTLTTPPI